MLRFERHKPNEKNGIKWNALWRFALKPMVSACERGLEHDPCFDHVQFLFLSNFFVNQSLKDPGYFWMFIGIIL